MPLMYFSVLSVFSLGLVLLNNNWVCAQNYPNKPIRIVASETGGSTDFVARQVAASLSDTFGQPVVVDNRAGAVITGEIVSKAPPDGYTLLFPGSSFWTGALLQKMPYDPIKDFVPITITHGQAHVLVVHPSVPAKSVKELIEIAKRKPGGLNYGSSSIGSTGHLAAALFESLAQVSMVHVPYRGSGGMVVGLLAGEVQLAFASSGSMSPLIKSGKIRALAVTSPQPSALLPGLPTVAASGVPGFEATQRAGMFAPARTPTPIVTRLNREVVSFLKKPDVKEKFLTAGIETIGSTPEEFAAVMKSEMARMGKVIKNAGIRTEGVF